MGCCRGERLFFCVAKGNLLSKIKNSWEGSNFERGCIKIFWCDLREQFIETIQTSRREAQTTKQPPSWKISALRDVMNPFHKLISAEKVLNIYMEIQKRIHLSYLLPRLLMLSSPQYEAAKKNFINSCKIELCMNNLFTQLKLNVNFGECFCFLVLLPAYCIWLTTRTVCMCVCGA